MVVIEYHLSCGRCEGKNYTRTVSSGHKNCTRSDLLRGCLCFRSVRAVHTCRQGWLFGGNAKIEVDIYANCRACGKRCHGNHTYWGWPRGDSSSSAIRCSCGAAGELSLRSGEEGHWLTRSLVTLSVAGVIAAPALAPLATWASVTSASVSVAASASLGVSAAIAASTKASVAREYERRDVQVVYDFDGGEGFRVLEVEARANKLYRRDPTGVHYGHEFVSTRPLEHHFVVMKARNDETGTTRYFAISWVLSRIFVIGHWSRRAAIEHHDADWKRPGGMAVNDGRRKRMEESWLLRCRAPSWRAKHVYRVVEAIVAKFSRGTYRTDASTDTSWPNLKGKEQATGNCQTLTAFVMRHFAT